MPIDSVVFSVVLFYLLFSFQYQFPASSPPTTLPPPPTTTPYKPYIDMRPKNRIELPIFRQTENNSIQLTDKGKLLFVISLLFTLLFMANCNY